MTRRHALVVGIDPYPGFGPESQLAGAARDARAMAEALIERHGFAAEGVLRLFDQEATRDALLDAFETLRLRVKAGDHVLFFFSGHGSQMTDREGDEGDGLDETLVPFDSGRGDADNRDLSDDEIHCWAARMLEVTSHLVLVFDCCHGGTLQRPGWRVRSVPADRRPTWALPPSPVPGEGGPHWRDVATGPRPLVATACRDDEPAVELPALDVGEARGAFSWHFTAALREAGPEATWREIFARAASAVVRQCPEQHPQLSGDGLDVPPFVDERPVSRRHDVGRQLLGLAERPDPFGLDMKLFRSRGGAWVRVEEASFIEGDRLRVDICHGHGRELFVYLFDVGLTGAVTLLFPDLDGHEALDPGTVLTVGARQGDGLDLCLPDGLAPEISGGRGRLLLLAAKSRLSTVRILSGDLDGIGDTAVTIARAYRLARLAAADHRP